MIDLKLIKKLCYESGITLKTLSENTNISQTALTMAMQRNSTTLETLEKISKYFGISVGYFFGEIDSYQPIRNSFEKFNKDVKGAISYLRTTLMYYNPEFNDNTPRETIYNAILKLPKEIINVINYTIKKVKENPVYSYLRQFSPNEIIQMGKDGILSKSTVNFILLYNTKLDKKQIAAALNEESILWSNVNKMNKEE